MGDSKWNTEDVSKIIVIVILILVLIGFAMWCFHGSGCSSPVKENCHGCNRGTAIYWLTFFIIIFSFALPMKIVPFVIIGWGFLLLAVIFMMQASGYDCHTEGECSKN